MTRQTIIGIIAAVTAIAYMGISYAVYDGLSRITGLCDDNAANRPDHFTCVSGCEGWETFDFDAYAMGSYETVRFPSRDGLDLSGWYIETDPRAAVVIVVHGYQVCKYHHDPLVQAGALHRAGFNVLLFDQRDCGDSQFEDGRTSYGSEEYLDALGAFDYLRDQRGYTADRIGMHGSSLGGAIALIAFAQEPQLQALFLDSPLTDGKAQFLEYTGLPGFLFPGVEWVASMVAGDDLTQFDILDGVRRSAGRALYVVHGTGDDVVLVSHTKRLLHVAAEAQIAVESWMPEGVGHVRTLATHPREYEDRLRSFFTRSLASH